MSEEPLEIWAQRRAADRARMVGRLRARSLASGPERASHVHPDAERVIEQWDGYQWVPVTVAVDLAAARSLLFVPEPADERATEWDRPATGEGTGRHRKPARVERPDA
ncbi:DUF6087 family protein [Streptomyces sp. H39-S7]|uniref:DUF6087 family protein n=1 Tax=Streptomyces sp. H39-S7 TaxID=3004357 RepID=UPI0022AF43F6|nr:DUF6087 family protein [Streptomyces sp. H39-S7]MCZ4125474.1 DUF6087 family protein [Streptomyces sp. H39-S7]